MCPSVPTEKYLKSTRCSNEFQNLRLQLPERSLSTKRHTVYNLVGALIPLAVALGTIPIYLHLIGDVRYGVLLLAWVLLGNFGVFDLGLGRALAQRIAALRDAKPTTRATAFWTALGANALFGLLGGAILLPVAGYFFSSMDSISPATRNEIDSAIIWLALAVPITTISGALAGALQGDARFLKLNVSSIIGSTLFQVLPLVAALFGHVELWALMPVVIFSRLLSMIALSFACKDFLASWRQARWSSSELKAMLRVGGWISVSSLVSPIVLSADRVVIGLLSGSSAVTTYGIPYQLGERSTILSFATASALFPRFATASPDEATRLVNEGQRLVAVIMTPAVVVAVMALGPFLGWWVSSAFAQKAALAGQILLIGFWISGFSKIPHLQLQAIGRPDLVSKSLVAQIVPYGLILYLAVSVLGALGAAIAFTIKAVFDSLILSWLTQELELILTVTAAPFFLLVSALCFSLVFDASANSWIIGLVVFFPASLAWAWWEMPMTYRGFALSVLKRARRAGSKN